MSTRRARMLRLDPRTGRLERACKLLEDGHKPGLMTREPDRKHPQSVPAQPGPDRASIKQPVRQYDKGITNFYCGYVATSALIRTNDFPVLSFGWTFGSFDYDTDAGYSHAGWGYGHQGYSGLGISPQNDVEWGG